MIIKEFCYLERKIKGCVHSPLSKKFLGLLSCFFSWIGACAAQIDQSLEHVKPKRSTLHGGEGSNENSNQLENYIRLVVGLRRNETLIGAKEWNPKCLLSTWKRFTVIVSNCPVVQLNSPTYWQVQCSELLTELLDRLLWIVFGTWLGELNLGCLCRKNLAYRWIAP